MSTDDPPKPDVAFGRPERVAFKPERVLVDQKAAKDWIIKDIKTGVMLGAPAFVLNHQNHDPGDEDRRSIDRDNPVVRRLIAAGVP